MAVFNCYLPDEAALLALAGEFAAVCPEGSIIYLSGDLGAGKTCWTRGFLRALGYVGNVKSPTYTLVETYQIKGHNIAHFDLYRLVAAEELAFIGLHEYFDGQTTVIIEWPERGAGTLPPADLDVRLAVFEQGRQFIGTAQSQQGEAILDRFQANRKEVG